MKCPKCNYTSFDYLDECIKCGTDLRDVRTLLQIIAVSPEERAPLLPPGEAPEPGAEMASVKAGEELAAPLAPESEEEGAEALFEGLDFDDSFENMVERTGYKDSEESPQPADSSLGEREDEDEEELLDLDFGEIFGESEEKKD